MVTSVETLLATSLPDHSQKTDHQLEAGLLADGNTASRSLEAVAVSKPSITSTNWPWGSTKTGPSSVFHWVVASAMETCTPAEAGDEAGREPPTACTCLYFFFKDWA